MQSCSQAAKTSKTDQALDVKTAKTNQASNVKSANKSQNFSMEIRPDKFEPDTTFNGWRASIGYYNFAGESFKIVTINHDPSGRYRSGSQLVYYGNEIDSYCLVYSEVTINGSKYKKHQYEDMDDDGMRLIIDVFTSAINQYIVFTC